MSFEEWKKLAEEVESLKAKTLKNNKYKSSEKNIDKAILAIRKVMDLLDAADRPELYNVKNDLTDVGIKMIVDGGRFSKTILCEALGIIYNKFGTDYVGSRQIIDVLIDSEISEQYMWTAYQWSFDGNKTRYSKEGILHKIKNPEGHPKFKWGINPEVVKYLKLYIK